MLCHPDSSTVWSMLGKAQAGGPIPRMRAEGRSLCHGNPAHYQCRALRSAVQVPSRSSLLGVYRHLGDFLANYLLPKMSAFVKMSIIRETIEGFNSPTSGAWKEGPGSVEDLNAGSDSLTPPFRVTTWLLTRPDTPLPASCPSSHLSRSTQQLSCSASSEPSSLL